jgi:hypothetical protein
LRLALDSSPELLFKQNSNLAFSESSTVEGGMAREKLLSEDSTKDGMPDEKRWGIRTCQVLLLLCSYPSNSLENDKISLCKIGTPAL